VYIAAKDMTPEAIGARFAQIESIDTSLELATGLAHVDRILERARAAQATDGATIRE
jgi:hypothetical protein